MTAQIWIKLIHIAAIATWSAGLLYLPALFAEHARAADGEDFRRIRRMTRTVFVGLASPAAVIAVFSGTLLIPMAAELGGWLVLKLAAVTGMVLLHVYMGKLLAGLYENPRMRRPGAHLALLLPGTMLVVAVIYLVTGKPL